MAGDDGLASPSQAIDFIAPANDRSSAAQKRTRFEIFSYQVNRDEENAA